MAFDKEKALLMSQAAEFIGGEIAKVAKVMSELVDGATTAAEIAETFVHVRQSQEAIYEAQKVLTKIKDHVSMGKIPEIFMEEGVRNITTESGFRVGTTTRVSVTFVETPIDREWLKSQEWANDFLIELPAEQSVISAKMAGYAWLRATGNGGLIQETVNASSLSAFTKDMVENEGKQPPGEIFNVKPALSASMTKVTKKAA